MRDKNAKKEYKKPEITFEKKIEAFAATCLANPLAKTSMGEPNSFGRTCQQLFS